jgi:hypothetical protein
MDLQCVICKKKIGENEIYSLDRRGDAVISRHYECYKEHEDVTLTLTLDTAKELKNLLKKLYPYPKDTNFVWEIINELNRRI